MPSREHGEVMLENFRNVVSVGTNGQENKNYKELHQKTKHEEEKNWFTNHIERKRHGRSKSKYKIKKTSASKCAEIQDISAQQDHQQKPRNYLEKCVTLFRHKPDSNKDYKTQNEAGKYLCWKDKKGYNGYLTLS